MKITMLLLMLILPVSVMAQERARLVEPVRVMAVTAEDTPLDRKFDALLRSELGRLRSVALTSRQADYAVTTATVDISDAERRWGYAVAVLAVEPSTGRYRLMIEVGPELSEIAARAASKLRNDVFQKRQGDK